MCLLLGLGALLDQDLEKSWSVVVLVLLLEQWLLEELEFWYLFGVPVLAGVVLLAERLAMPRFLALVLVRRFPLQMGLKLLQVLASNALHRQAEVLSVRIRWRRI